jgi:hypothetical protein
MLDEGNLIRELDEGNKFNRSAEGKMFSMEVDEEEACLSENQMKETC